MDKARVKIEESKLKVYGEDYLRVISAKESFGWKLNGTKKNKPKKYKTYKIEFTRPVNLPYRERLVELEKMYFNKESTRKTFYQTDFLNYILLYLLAIIPGLIYTIVKVHSKKKIKKYNENITKAQQVYINEAKSILNNSSNPQARAVPSTSANKPVSTRQNPQMQHRPVQQNGRPVQQVRRPVQQNGRPIQQNGRPVQQVRRPVQQNGRPVQQAARPVQQQKAAPVAQKNYGNDKFN